MAWNTDSLYISRAAAGDDQAFQVLVDRYRSALVRIVGRLTASYDEREDVVQETWLKTLEAIRNGKYTHDGTLLPWLATIARNVFIDLRRRRVSSEVQLPNNEPIDASMSALQFATVRSLLEFLQLELAVALGVDPEKPKGRLATLKWIAFFYYYLDGHTTEHIVELLSEPARRAGLTEPTYFAVNNWVSGRRSVEKLVDHLVRNHPESLDALTNQAVESAGLTSSERAAWQQMLREPKSGASSEQDPALTKAITKIAALLTAQICAALHEARKKGS